MSTNMFNYIELSNYVFLFLLEDITTSLDNFFKLTNYLTCFRTESNTESETGNDPEETDRLEEDDPGDDSHLIDTETETTQPLLPRNLDNS